MSLRQQQQQKVNYPLSFQRTTTPRSTLRLPSATLIKNIQIDQLKNKLKLKLKLKLHLKLKLPNSHHILSKFNKALIKKQLQINNQMVSYILTKDEHYFLTNHFHVGYDSLLNTWIAQESKNKAILKSKKGVHSFPMLSFPSLKINDSDLLKSEKVHIKYIIDSRTNVKHPRTHFSPEDTYILNDLRSLNNNEIIIKAKMRIYEKWQDLVNLIIMRTKELNN